MTHTDTLQKFLDLVRKKRAGVNALNGIYLMFTLLIGAYLVGTLFTNFLAQSRNYVLAFFFLCSAPIAYIFYHYFVRGVFSRFSRDQAALLVEAKYPDLNSSLINSYQLQRYLEDAEADLHMSIAFVRELVRNTSSRIQEISADSVIDCADVPRNRNLFLLTAGLLVVLTMTVPDFLIRGYRNLTALQKPISAASPTQVIDEKSATSNHPLPVYTIRNITLTFNYPAYTQLKSTAINNSDGKINVLPGTEVRIQAKVDQPIDAANLIYNGNDSFVMSLNSGNEITAQFLVREQGSYRFQIKSPDGRMVLLPVEHPITLIRDQPPKIILLVSNPKPVYFADEQVRLFYDARDDYGIQKIDLITEVNGKTERTTIKNLKTATRELKDNYTWNLSGLDSADKVKYYLEVQDNDNISGPNTGQSEIFSFSIHDIRSEKDNLIQLQEELTEKSILLLAQSLVGNDTFFQREPDATILKKFIANSADQVMNIIGLAQNIQNQSKNIPSFPDFYTILLKNIVSGLTQIRGEQLEVLRKLTGSITQSTPIGLNFPPIQDVTQKLIAHLEQDILYLIKVTNQQKMDRVTDMKDDLNDLATALKKELNNSKAGKNKPNLANLKTQIEKMKQTLKKISDQLNRQTQPTADEYLNPNAFKSMDLEKISAALDNIMKLANQNKLDEAMKEMEKLTDSLKALSKQIENSSADKRGIVDKEMMKKIDESLGNILAMEKKQTEVLEEISKINSSLKNAQSKNSEASLKKLFDELGQLVDQVRAIFQEDDEFLQQHQAIKKFEELSELETKTTNKIQELGQKTLDAHQKGESSSEIKALNEARSRLSEIVAEKEALRVKAFSRFQSTLPKVSEGYKSLKELADLLDLTEFNKQFKNLYPEIFRMQLDLQMTPNAREDLADRLNMDMKKATQLNSDISKKLGTMARSLEREYQSLMTRQNKEEMERMAKQESQMEGETAQMSQLFNKMTQQNPMINPELGTKISEAGRHMKLTDGHLSQHNIPKSLDAGNSALERLIETRDMLNELKKNGDTNGQKSQQETVKLGTGRAQDKKQGGGIRTQSEQVELPSQDQYQAPGEFRDEILKAMKNKYPGKYEHFVNEYYKELVK